MNDSEDHPSKLTREQIEAAAELYISRHQSAAEWAEWIIEQINIGWCDGYNRGLIDRNERGKETAP